MPDVVAFKPDLWLAGLLGKPCFQLFGGAAVLSSGDLPAGPCFVEAKVPAPEAAALLRLQALGFRVVDSNVQLVRPAAELATGDAAKAFAVRFGRVGDEAGVRLLARTAFEHNRFHRDPDIGADLAGRIKEAWAANFFTGQRGDWMVVAEARGAVIGFLQLLDAAERSVVIDLVAVAEAWRGRSVARSMIALAATACRGAPTLLRVGTQLGNMASLRLYGGLGFRVESASYSLHLHREVHVR